MVDTNTGCPHCGFTDYDEMEICQACGFLSEDTSVRNISFSQVVGGLFSYVQEKSGFEFQTNLRSNPFHEDAWSDPGWSTLTGNLYNYDHD